MRWITEWSITVLNFAVSHLNRKNIRPHKPPNPCNRGWTSKFSISMRDISMQFKSSIVKNHPILCVVNKRFLRSLQFKSHLIHKNLDSSSFKFWIFPSQNSSRCIASELRVNQNYSLRFASRKFLPPVWQMTWQQAFDTKIKCAWGRRGENRNWKLKQHKHSLWLPSFADN